MGIGIERNMSRRGAAKKKAKGGLTEEQIEEIREAFNLFDADNSGKISLRNLRRVAQELGENIDEEELQDMINQADRDGEINIDEFYRIMKKKGNFLEDLSSDDDF